MTDPYTPAAVAPPSPADPALATWPWQQRFANLGPDFVAPIAPAPLPAPYWVGQSPTLAQSLGLPPGWAATDSALQAMTGNLLLQGSAMHAGVYSGHQFGVWAGQLGDGRACLLGELAGQEIQLKGAGPTPFSRRGDGRAVLRSAIREYLCSEAMHGLGIPTTRALCVTGSDAPIWRETAETAAVVARVAPSFIRFGHFEHFSQRQQIPQLKTL
ncbi:MAG: YdiU family protein, partial [Rhodoferax sp.]|nr:YdiU family protein [Rhodoferax sp.]